MTPDDGTVRDEDKPTHITHKKCVENLILTYSLDDSSRAHAPLPENNENAQNTCDPKWNEPLSFTVPTGTLVDAQLFLRVVGKQKLRDDIALGRVELPLAGITSADASMVAGGVGGGGTRGKQSADGGRWFALEEGQGRLKIDADLVTRRPSLIV